MKAEAEVKKDSTSNEDEIDSSDEALLEEADSNSELDQSSETGIKVSTKETNQSKNKKPDVKASKVVSVPKKDAIKKEEVKAKPTPAAPVV